MPKSLSKIVLHIIFSTKNRYPFIKPEINEELHRYIMGICQAKLCYPHNVGGTENHIHILCEFSRTLTVATLLQEIKQSSSKWIKTKNIMYEKFAWQNGYGAFSIGMSQLDQVKKYIYNQEEHHKKMTFKEEYLKFLKKYAVEYDEKYLWD